MLPRQQLVVVSSLTLLYAVLGVAVELQSAQLSDAVLQKQGSLDFVHCTFHVHASVSTRW